MSTLGGIEAAARLRWIVPKTRIIFLSQQTPKYIAASLL
jgi:hypothetical protein